MNKYARLAQRHWTEFAPAKVAELDDPASFFTTLGEEVATQVNQIAVGLEGPDLPGESYLDKVGRLNNAKLRAEEIVLADLVWIEPEDEEEEGGPPADGWFVGPWEPTPEEREIDEEYWAAAKAGRVPFMN